MRKKQSQGASRMVVNALEGGNPVPSELRMVIDALEKKKVGL
jgi:hypothetical protein